MLDKLKEFLEKENIEYKEFHYGIEYCICDYNIGINNLFEVYLYEPQIYCEQFEEYKKEHDKRSYDFIKVEEHIKKLNEILEEK